MLQLIRMLPNAAAFDCATLVLVCAIGVGDRIILDGDDAAEKAVLCCRGGETTVWGTLGIIGMGGSLGFWGDGDLLMNCG